MDTPKLRLFLLLLSMLVSCCSTGSTTPIKHQSLHSSKKQQITSPAQGNNPATVTVQPNPPLATAPPATPVTGALSPPTTTTPPATLSPPAAGESWCVAKAGAPTASVQAALDYACWSGAECGAIQQGGPCYNPNGLQNHASYAFNSYYLKHSRLATSCDFKGAAQLVNVNPSSGSCIYPTSSSTTTPSSPGSFAAPPTVDGNNTGISPTTSSASSISPMSRMQLTFISCIILGGTFFAGNTKT